MKTRKDKLIERFNELNIDGFLSIKPENLHYIAGFTGSTGACLIRRDGYSVFLTDSRYDVQASKEVIDCEVVITKSTLHADICRAIRESGIKSLGIEADYMSVATKNRLADEIGETSLVDTDQVIELIRAVKDDDEIILIKKAVEIADKAFEMVLDVIKPGVREIDVAVELEYNMRKLGGEKPGFDTIIASGYRSAMAHGKASDKTIEYGDPIVMDFGSFYKGYTSDMTRTVCIGDMDPELEKIYEIVLEAQIEACNNITAGMTGKEADSYSRSIIEKSGYGERFGHGLGHGVGLEVHEYPSLSPRNEKQLQKNMVVSVEPGIYLPGKGGVRIEDLVVLEDDKAHILTSSPKELIRL